MKTLILGAISTLGLTAAAGATEYELRQGMGPAFEQVDHFSALTDIRGWKAVDDDTLIVWASPSKPYLIELYRPSHDLRFAETIGLSEFAGRVHAKFDSVYVRGIAYKIDGIYKLTPEEAKTF